jgi:thiamine biosynthesis lipoprotein
MEPVSEGAFVLGTAIRVTLYDRAPEAIFTRVFEEMQVIEDKMSLSYEGGEIMAVNSAAGEHPVIVSRETFGVVEAGLQYSQLSGGAFDITIGPLVRLWGIEPGEGEVPPQAAIEDRLSLVDYRNVVLDREEMSIFLTEPEMAIDLGAIAKGYAGDKAADMLENSGVGHALLDFGGNIVTVGRKPDGSRWRIGIQNPEDDRGRYLGILEVGEAAVVTSGVYERYFIQDGVRYHHILDTDTGYPVWNGLSSATVIAGQSTAADALSTAVFSLGLVDGLDLVERLPDVEAIMVAEDGTVYVTPGAQRDFRLTDAAFTLRPSSEAGSTALPADD